MRLSNVVKRFLVFGVLIATAAIGLGTSKAPKMNRRWLQRVTLVGVLTFCVSGCVYEPPPAPAYAYAPGYYYYPGYYYPYPYPYYYGPPIYGSVDVFFGGHRRWH